MERLRSICRRHRLLYLVFFGSRAGGKGDALSDWDFAARFGRKPSLHEVARLVGDITDILRDDRVDLVVLDRAGLPPALLYEALWRGKLVCMEDRDAYLWDRVRALSLYQEYRVVFRPALVEAMKRLAQRGVIKKD